MILTMRSFLHIDFLSFIAAAVWAVTAKFVPEINEIVASEAASAFATAAVARWAYAQQPAKKD